MSKNILVTGGCGYKGNLLIKKLLDQNYKVYNIDLQWFGNNISKNKNFFNIKKNITDIDKIKLPKIDTVIHLASVANDPSGMLNSKLTWEINVLGTMILCEWAKNNKIKTFIYSSSGSVYGVKKEKQVTENLKLEPISDYNKTKMVSEKVILNYKNDFRVIIARPATVCGYSKRIRFDVAVNMLVMQAMTKKEITVLGGKQIRPNVHIEDITNFYIFAMINKKVNGIFNIGNENLSIIQIANKIKNKIKGTKIKIKKSNDPRSYRLNSDKSKKIGFKYNFKTDDAIKDIIQLFKQKKIKNLKIFSNVMWMKEKKIHKNF